MQKRSSTRGEFWGCRGYPECRGTRPVEAGVTSGYSRALLHLQSQPRSPRQGGASGEFTPLRGERATGSGRDRAAVELASDFGDL
ncbi:MAG: hypothetical protein HN919_22975 [Verrucomicrobia bacterium]|nr:hypothetical protein [Verrucomicrobiota bacterium]MBT7069177.1 hypothetical protein [Verrucomicrobiota bacterium]MBT7699611.1 hypothetical protein [Verrucomicrobiota bacterium]